MKAFKVKLQFYGSYYEDLDECIDVFDTLAEIFEVTDEQKRKVIPIIILKGEALALPSRKVKGSKTNEYAINMLRGWYNSSEKQSRILKE